MSASLPLFLALAALMAAAAIGAVVWPLLRRRAEPREPLGRSRLSAVVVALTLPLAASLLYGTWSNWSWQADARVAGAGDEDVAPEILVMVARLEERLQREGGSIEDWMMLGRSRIQLKQFTGAAEAYRQAYRLSGGTDVGALTDYAEALVMADPNALAVDAGDLFDKALKLDPGNAKALWYGGLVSFQRARFEEARARWQQFLAHDPPPPPEVRNIVLDRIAQVEARLGIAAAPPTATASSETSPPAARSDGAVQVRVTLAPELASRVDENAPLFVIARARGGGGPPIAVVRRTSSELPLTIALSDADAMIPGRTLSSQSEFEIVARVALGGQPVAQPGDLFGRTEYVAASGEKNASIEINQIQP